MTAIGRKTETWGSKFGFIMAAVGSSVGLGNFWRFPFTAGENGGGAFILIYLICVLALGLPVLMAEYGMGRKSGMSAVEGVHSLARAEGKSSNWGALGWIGSLAAFFILTFYMVISAWIIDYIPQTFSGSFENFSEHAAVLTSGIGGSADAIMSQLGTFDPNSCGFVADGNIVQQFQDKIDPATGQVLLDASGNAIQEARDYRAADLSGCRFGGTIGDRGSILFWLFVFILANVFVLARGVKGGIERAASILMPLFFILLVFIVIYALSIGNASKAASFLLTPDFSKVDMGTFLAAVGQAFFSIGVGSCLMITYGAYLSDDTSIPRSSGIIAGADTIVALIAGFAIFPIVFAFGADPAAGPGLFFVSLPIAFGEMPFGSLVGGAFFTLALFAAFTSSISLMEVGVSWLEERQGVTRPGAAIGVGFVLFMIGAGYVYSADYIDFADFITGNIMLPLGGLLVAVFGGWVLSREMMTSEFGEGSIMNVWRFAVRWVVPPALTFILIFGSLATADANGWIELPNWLSNLLNPQD